MKREGLDPKDASVKQIEVPTDKPGLLEFLTFYNVRRIPDAVGAMIAPQVTPAPQEPAAGAVPTTVSPLPEMFDAAPLRLQLDLAVSAIDRASAQLFPA